MRGLSGTHIDEFHIIVCVRRKMHKAGMGTDLYGLTTLDQPLVIDHMGLRLHIASAIHIDLSLKIALFFIADLS